MMRVAMRPRNFGGNQQRVDPDDSEHLSPAGSGGSQAANERLSIGHLHRAIS
jgi:hypothetical protein